MATNYELVYKLGAEVSSQFMSSFNKASGAVKEMTGAIGGLTKASSDVSKLIKLRQAADKSTKAYEQQKAVVENLRQNMDKLHGSDSKMARALEIETEKLSKAKQAMLSQSQAAAELGAKLKLTGVSTTDLIKRQDGLTKAMERVNRIQSRLNNVNAMQQKTDQAAMSSALMVGLLARKAVSMFSAPVQSAMQMEEVMRNLGETLNIRSPEALAQMQKQFEDMSVTIPVAKENLVEMYALAKQNGIGGDLSQFTQQAAKFATILKVDGKEAVSMFTDWNAKLSQTTDETFKLANATVMLSNHNSGFAKSIGQTVLAVGEYAQRAGLAATQTAAIASAMISTGSSAEDAAMGIRQMLKVLGSGENLSKGQLSAFQTIGLGDPKKLQADLQKDAAGVMLNVLKKVRDTIPQGQQLSLLEQMFGGKQAGKTILPMMRNLDALAANFEKVANAENYTSAMEDEFNSRMQNTTNILELAKNAWDNFITMIGEPLLGPLKDALKTFLDLIKPVGEFIRNNRELVTTVTKVGLILGSAVIAFHAVRAAVLFTVSPILSLYKGYLMLQKGVALVNVALKAGFISPLGLAVGAIAAVVAAGVLLYKNWDKVKAKVTELWTAFNEKFPGLASIVKAAYNAIAAAGRVIVKAWDVISETVVELWGKFSENFPAIGEVVQKVYESSIKPIVDGIQKTFSGLIDFITGVFTANWTKAWEGVKTAFAGIWQSLSGIIKGPINAIITAINYVIKGVNSLGSFSVPDWVPGVGGKSVGINIPEIPKLATGGIVSSPTTAMVGEGREPEAVLPLSRLAGMMGGGTGLGGVSVNYSPVINVSGTDATTSDIRNALATSRDDFMREFERMIRQQRRISFS